MATEREILEELVYRQQYGGFSRLYPAEGPLSLPNYPKHKAFFDAGATERERAVLGGNRIGKSEGIGGYEVAVHLTGQYPDWWQGRRFSRPVHGWAAGQTNETTRDVVQAKLLGPPGVKEKQGTGLLPYDTLLSTRPRPGVPDAVSSIHVKHASGGTSIVDLKSYDQGPDKFTGTHREFVWFDEEPPQPVYAEGLARTTGTGRKPPGLTLCTFTPLKGMSNVVQGFLGGQGWFIHIAQDEVPHLDPVEIAEILARYPAYQREARNKGLPVIGAGKIWPYEEGSFLIDPFSIPTYWVKGYGFDVGWNATAGIWGALDRDTDILYLYSEYKQGEQPPAVHVSAVKGRGDWMTGAIDPASRGRGQRDGESLLDEYRQLGLNLTEAENAVEAGLFSVEQRFQDGRIKVFRTLTNWLDEWRFYRRDEKGRVVKENDHLMDCTRYLEMTSGVMGWEPGRGRGRTVLRASG